jgi:hypothetical protein
VVAQELLRYWREWWWVMSQNNKPPWARLYITALLWFGLLVVVFLMPMSPGWQKVIGCMIAFAFLGMLARWLYVNRVALAREDYENWEKRVRKRTSPQRDVPLRPVQAHYLRVMEHYTGKKE